MSMKRFIFTLAFLVAAASSFAAEKKTLPTDAELDYAQIVSEISGVGKPYMKDGNIIFTAPHKYRHIGIAFDFENYRVIHSFKIKKLYDMDFNTKDSLFFYILELPKNVQEVKYRMVFDGLWTLDPLNDTRVFDESTNLFLSYFNASRTIPDVTEVKNNGKVRFVYKGESGQQIRLGGSFTCWDSWIYEMKEISPGLYEFELALAPGTYEYAFYSGMTSFIDRANPDRCYTADGKEASQLIVE